ncbi:hypothetical protein GCM10027200_54710 [Lentzea nigeriaca]
MNWGPEGARAPTSCLAQASDHAKQLVYVLGRGVEGAGPSWYGRKQGRAAGHCAVFGGKFVEDSFISGRTGGVNALGGRRSHGPTMRLSGNPATTESGVQQ